MSEITGTVIKLRDFLFDVDTQITIKYNGQSTPSLHLQKVEFYLFLTTKEKFVGRKKLFLPL